MNQSVLLAFLGGLSILAIVFVVCLVQLYRMRFDDRPYRRQHRHRSRLSRLRSRFFHDESLRRRSHAHHPHAVRRTVS
jgi:hypothetical protein